MAFRDPWAPLGSREEIRELLALTLQIPDPIIRLENRQMIDRLIGPGCGNYGLAPTQAQLAPSEAV